MYRLKLGVPALAFLCCAVFATSLFAQRPRYQPRTPRFSPYLDYFKRDVGALDVYNSIVRPNRDVRSEFARQRLGQAEQSGQIEKLGQQIRGRNDLAPTGIGASFMNFSHYYQRRRVGR